MACFGFSGWTPPPTDLGPSVCPRCGGDRCGCASTKGLPEFGLPEPGQTMRCGSRHKPTDTLTLSWHECPACAAKRGHC